MAQKKTEKRLFEVMLIDMVIEMDMDVVIDMVMD